MKHLEDNRSVHSYLGAGDSVGSSEGLFEGCLLVVGCSLGDGLERAKERDLQVSCAFDEVRVR